MKEFSVEKTLDPLMNDLKTLEVDGIFVERLGISLKGSIAYVSGDNLSSNYIGGFSVSFSSDNARICRQCMIKKIDIGNGVDVKLRTPKDYDHHVSEIEIDHNNTSIYGIRCRSILNDLNYFHVCEGLPPDPMHDILEGIAPYELALIFKSLIGDRYLDLDLLNNRISKFKYAKNDKVNKTSLISLAALQKKNIGGTSSMTQTLIRLLPLIVGDLIPEDGSCKCWSLFLSLKQITEIALAPKLTMNMVSYLKYLVDMHLSQFKEIFPQENLKPKHHFIEHYYEAILNYGPLINCWCMRFEAKHQYFKNVAKRSRNFTDVIKSVAEKHSLLMAYYLSEENFFNAEMYVGNSSFVLHSQINKSISDELYKCTGESKEGYSRTKSVVWRGISYSENQVLCVNDVITSNPIFVEINSIWIENKKVYFWCQHYIPIYNGHLHIYELDSTDQHSLIPIENLLDYYPLNVYKMPEGLHIKGVSLHHAIPSLFESADNV
ncbi:hypothetical protein JTE90_022247 [Oedothorax gibbosus]|uniref:Uncharacterized protein n=1 Tax=Oedothorax gibbosus TaxID=931172 RepID=A0AAV6VVH9_9ARAC|nr:hypothetical protein JTE90_022247 [Oedothorax gibbosus]